MHSRGIILRTIGIALFCLTGCAHPFGYHDPPPSYIPRPGWTLTWSDEFDQPNGSPPDPTKWKIETGGNGWGNNELEYYTARPQNLRVSNGNLEMIALKESYTGPDGVSCNYTWECACLTISALTTSTPVVSGYFAYSTKDGTLTSRAHFANAAGFSFQS